MKMPSWPKKTKNDREASTSRCARRSGRTPSPPAPVARSRAAARPPPVFLRQLPPTPRTEDYVGQGAPVDASPPRQRDRRYVPLEECEAFWAVNQSVDHHDVSPLPPPPPHGWHLNRARVPIPPAPPAGPKLDAEIRRHIRNLPQALRVDRKYRNRQF
jgi:hypothetical protein